MLAQALGLATAQELAQVAVRALLLVAEAELAGLASVEVGPLLVLVLCEQSQPIARRQRAHREILYVHGPRCKTPFLCVVWGCF